MSTEQGFDKISSIDIEGDLLTPKSNNPVLVRTVTVFTPERFNCIAKDAYNENELHKLVRNNSLNEKLGARIFRVIATLFLAILGLILVVVTPDNFHITKVMSIGIFLTISFYLLHLYYYVYNCDIANRIYSLTDTVPGWIKMPITCRQIMYKYQPITSISEFSAIGGGSANQMLLVISICAWMIILIQGLNNIWFEKIWLSYVNKIICDECEYTKASIFRGCDQILIFLGTFGMVLIGIFDLDPYSFTLQTIHLTGVGLAILCPIGFLVQQINGNRPFGIIIAIILILIVLISTILWKLIYQRRADNISHKYNKNPPNTINDIDKANKQVRALTIKNVVSESGVLFCGAFSLTLWLWYFDNINTVFNTKDGNLPFGPFEDYLQHIISKYQCNASLIKPFNMESLQFCQ